MGIFRKHLGSFNVRKAMRITNVRIATQAFFFFLFLFLVWATWTARIGGYPVSRILEMDPLVAISTFISTGYVYRFLGWSLIFRTEEFDGQSGGNVTGQFVAGYRARF